MGHVQTTIRKQITWAQVHDLALVANKSRTEMSNSHSQSTVRFVRIFAILIKVNWVRLCFWNYPLTSYFFSKDRRLKFSFLKCMWNKLCSWAAPLKFWFQTDLGRENSTGFYFWLFSPWSRCSPNFYVSLSAKTGQGPRVEVSRFLSNSYHSLPFWYDFKKYSLSNLIGFFSCDFDQPPFFWLICIRLPS